MTRRLLSISAVLLALSGMSIPARAGQILTQIVNFGGPRVTYAGPVDAIGTVSFYFGLRAMSAAYAVSQGNSIFLELPLDASGELEKFGPDGQIAYGSVGLGCGGATTCTVKKWYDQALTITGPTQTTIANRMVIVPRAGGNGCPNNRDCATMAGAANYTSTITGPAQPWSMGGVMERTGSFTSPSYFIGDASTATVVGYANGATNTADYACVSASITATAADSTPHSLQGISASGSNNSALVVDGTPTAGTCTGDYGTNLSLSLSGEQPTGIFEYGFLKAGAINSTQYGNLRTQDSAFYGTP